ncbi:MAG TPA: ABC transporter substrate-binding protein [Dehalococcoidia bacterium]|nr:ABC transporter substrate-binding protein [Dehalococcoidia bacterium]
MDTSNYWQRLAARRLSRRRLLAGAAGVGGGLAALSLVGCGGGGEEKPPSGSPSPGATVAASPSGTPSSSRVFHRWGAGAHPPLEPVKTKGGILRWFGAEAITLDTFDPHQTQFGPLFSTHAAVFSKVLKYRDAYQGIIERDLAEAMPETPDELTYIVKIRPDVRFHDTEKIRQAFPDTAGRQLTAEDVKYSIERQVNRDSPKAALYYHMGQWETVDRVEVMDPLTLKITTKKPVAPFVHYLADTNAFIIPKELVDPAKDDMNSVDKMVGSGPFMLDKFVALQLLRAVRNPNWFAKDDLADQGLPDMPILDGFESIWSPEDDTAIEVAFASKQVDHAAMGDHRSPDRVAVDTESFVEEWISSSWVNSRLLLADSETAASPFKDLRLRQAISIAIDRSRMGQQMFQGYCNIGAPVALALTNWALPLDELAKKPGYRFKREEREQDLVEAKQMWEAAGGSSVGTVTVVYSNIPASVADYWPQLQRQLKEVLGLETQGHLDQTGYTEIAQGLLQKRIVFSFSWDNGVLDPDDYLFPYFHSTGPKNSFNLSDPTLDQMLVAQREEFDQERRKQLVYDIQHYLLDNVVARLDWVGDISRGPRWPYVKNRWFAPWFGDTYQLVHAWLDSTDPTYKGRPS